MQNQVSFVGTAHEIFSTVILSLPLIQERGSCQLLAKESAHVLVNCLEDYACPGKKWLGKLTGLT